MMKGTLIIIPGKIVNLIRKYNIAGRSFQIDNTQNEALDHERVLAKKIAKPFWRFYLLGFQDKYD